MSSSSLPFHLPIPTSPCPPNPTLNNHHSPLCLNPDSSDHTAKPRTPSIRSRLSQLCRDGKPHEARRLFDAIPKPTTVLWNTIIIGLVCNNLPLDAILFYAHMKTTALYTKCDPYTYSSVLKACAVSAQLKIGKAVHSHVLRDHSNASRIVCNSLLNMYATCLNAPWEAEGGDLDLVQKVFDTMRKRNVVAWNTLISWYVKTSRFSAAIEKFKLMMKIGIKPTPVSFVHVFPAVLGMGDILGSNVLYGLLVKLGGDYVNDLHAVSSAIYMYAGFACADVARKIFDCCLERNTEVWNTMIAGYAQNNCPIEALDLFLEVFESEEIVLDDVTFLSALTSASQLQELDFGQQLHACIIKSLPTLPIAIINAIIVMYSRCNSVEISFKVFDKMHDRDLVSWNTMVSAFVQNGFNDEGLMLVYEMQNQGFMIDCVTATALLSAASNLQNREIGKQTHAYLFRHGIQFEGMYSYLIDMYAKSGLIRSAQGLFEKLHDHDRDHATWNAIIAGYTQNDLIAEAFFVLRQMLEKKMIPNAISIASILPACNSMGSINLGKQLHGFSIRYSLDQNVFVSSALVDMYSKLGAISCAENVFSDAVEKNTLSSHVWHGVGEDQIKLTA
ncbi:Pentatricopeptide repeat [Dillenia turbinata]|uniref:Pentatricopeptide repeat n=1 Tax=Dillenia turbinata TaxID=194707 RepID=A0AAN8UZG5_9MAGN